MLYGHPPCGEGACSRWTAQQASLIQGRCAPQREQAPSPQGYLLPVRRPLNGVVQIGRPPTWPPPYESLDSRKLHDAAERALDHYLNPAAQIMTSTGEPESMYLAKRWASHRWSCSENWR